MIETGAARAALHESLELYQAERNPAAATAWLDLGIAAAIHGDLYSAATAYEAALAMGRELRDEVVVYRALYNLGELARNRRKYEQAHALHEESLRLAERYGDTRNRALALASLGRLAWMQGDYKQAAALNRDSLHFWRHRRDQGGIALSLEGLAWVASARGQVR